MPTIHGINMLIYIKDYDDDSSSNKPDYDQPFVINSDYLEYINVVYYRDTTRYGIKIVTNSFEVPLKPFMCGQDIISTKESHDRAIQAIKNISKLLSETGFNGNCIIMINDYGVKSILSSSLN